MAAWRIPFPDDMVRRLDILPGKPSVLAVWSRGSSVCYHNLTTGERLGEHSYSSVPTDQRDSEAWRSFVERLKAPNDVVLPLAYAGGAALHLSLDGRQRLLQAGGALVFDADGSETPLVPAVGTHVAAVSLDRMLGLVAAVDAEGKLHLFRQQVGLGVFDLGLSPSEDMRPSLAVGDGGAAIFVTDGQRVVIADSTGQIRRQLSLHYRASSLVCSPDGQLLVIGDSETGVIRVYDGMSLEPQYQRFASDLLAEARSATLTPGTHAPTALGTLAVSNRGTLAFTLSSSVCVSNVGRMRPIPRE